MPSLVQDIYETCCKRSMWIFFSIIGPVKFPFGDENGTSWYKFYEWETGSQIRETSEYEDSRCLTWPLYTSIVLQRWLLMTCHSILGQEMGFIYRVTLKNILKRCNIREHVKYPQVCTNHKEVSCIINYCMWFSRRQNIMSEWVTMCLIKGIKLQVINMTWVLDF